MKKIISILTTIIMILSLCTFFSINSAAAGNSTMSFSKKQINVDETVTVTIKLNANEKMYALEFALNYDPAVLEFVEGDDCSGGAGIISVAAANSSSTASKRFKFKAQKAGSCYISTADMAYVNENEEIISVANQGANLTVKDATLSGDAKLKSLSLSDGTLSPAFSANRTSYTAEVTNDVTSCKIYATASDSNATVKINGNSKLSVGKNNCEVTVTAPNGTQKIYKIVITRSADKLSPDTSSEEDTSSDETVSGEPGSLDTQINGTTHTVLKNLENVTLPMGYSEKTIDYKGNEISVATDSSENYILYYLNTADGKTAQPYTYDSVSDTFTRVKYLKQGEYFYIFTDIPEDYEIVQGYYPTNTQISEFNVPCYSSNESELSSFYYIYCFNGTEYGFYRYDSVEKILQRYPELKPTAIYSVENEEKGFISKFNSLTTNAKIIVLGMVLVILGILALLILFVIKLFYRRGEAEFVSNIDYTEDFDNIEYTSAFSLDNSNSFLTEDNEDDETLDDIDDTQSVDEIESDYVTEEENEE